MKRDCTCRSFKHVTNFYCYYCHGFGHREVDRRKPKFDNNNNSSNIRMYRGTNPAGSERRRSSERIPSERERHNGVRNHTIYYDK